MEEFVNGGRVCAVCVIYPLDENLGVNVFPLGGKTIVRGLDNWKMHSSRDA